MNGADVCVGGKKKNRAAPGGEYPQPGVGCPAADRGCMDCIWHKDVAAHEAGREGKGSEAFDDEEGKVATGSATALKRLAWGLHVPLDAAGIDELLPDAECHRAKQGDGAGGPRRRQETCRPMIDGRCRAVPFQSASKVGPVIARVG